MGTWLSFEALRSRVHWIVGMVGALLIFMPAVNMVSVMLGGGEQLSYTHGIASSSCRIEKAPCWTVVDFQVGNTGSVSQDLVEIDLTAFPDWSNMGQRVVNIVASGAELEAPEVTIDTGRKQVRIEDLEANQMVEFELLVVGRSARASLDDAMPVISASGRVIKSSPKATALARAFRTAFAFLL